MRRGATMTKCRPKDHYERRFFLADDNQHIRWEPSKDAASRLPVSSIKFVRLGQCTKTFRLGTHLEADYVMVRPV